MQLLARPREYPRDQVAELSRQAVAHEHDDERCNDDTEHSDADERDGCERRRLLTGDGQQEDRDDRKREVQELVPQTRERDGARKVACGEVPAPQHPIRARGARSDPSGHDDRQRGRRLRQLHRSKERESRQTHLPRRRERDEIQERRTQERRDPRPRQLLDDGPDIGVVRDRREEEDEGRDDDAEAHRCESDATKQAAFLASAQLFFSDWHGAAQSVVATKRRCRRETTRCTRALGIAGVGAAPARPRPEPPAARGASAAVGPRLQQPLPKTEEGQEDGDRGRQDHDRSNM